MSAATFTVLGSSSGLPQANRACSGYLLQTGESLSLIDCGGGVTSSFLRCGFDPMKLDRVFISHTHSDHCCELSLMIQLLHVRGSTRPLEVFVPDEFVRPFMSYLNAVYMFPQHVAPALRIYGYADGFAYRGDGFELTAIANFHLEKARELVEQYDVPNKCQCHSFKITTDNAALFYSADLASLDDISDRLEDLDYAIIESTHIDLDALFDHARESTVRRYILTHLGGDDEVAQLHAKIETSGLDNFLLAADGLRLDM